MRCAYPTRCSQWLNRKGIAPHRAAGSHVTMDKKGAIYSIGCGEGGQVEKRRLVERKKRTEEGRGNGKGDEGGKGLEESEVKGELREGGIDSWRLRENKDVSSGKRGEGLSVRGQ